MSSVREFTDSHGVVWRVWRNRAGRPDVAEPAVHGGWLTFVSAARLRHLAPAPEGWELLSDAALERLCRLAQDVRQRERAGDLSSGLPGTFPDIPPGGASHNHRSD